jgi:hypothetical protein
VALRALAFKKLRKVFFTVFFMAVATVDRMSQFFPYVPAIFAVWTTVNVFRFGRQPSMDMDGLINW